MRHPAALAALLLCAAPAAAQLRVLSWNISDTSAADFAAGSSPDRRTAVTTVLQAIGTESVAGIARPVDIFLIQEARTGGGTGTTFVNILNGLYGAGAYARGTLEGATTGNGTQTVVYRTATVQLAGETKLDIISGTSGAARDPLRHQLRPLGYDAAADVYYYNSHYKSATGSTNEARRLAEATAIRADADALGANVRAVYAGDFNTYTSAEDAYVKLRSAGNGQAIDPVLSSGDWTNGTLQANRALHSQSPVTTALYPSQATGGMDDRFDFQLPTANMAATGRGTHVISGTYRVFGNNGTHAFNGELTSGSQPANVLSALRLTSEHLPVVVDYTIPARLTATVTGATQRVIKGATATVTLNVSNTPPSVAGASAFVAAGVDPLDYSYSRTGAVVGSGSATGLVAFAAANPHALTVPTTAIGTYSGAVTTSATSAQAFNAAASTAVTVTALDPSRGSFASAIQTTSLSVNLGTVTVGQTGQQSRAVYNLTGVGGNATLTSNLLFQSLQEQFAGGPITATLMPTTDLPAGSGSWTLTLTATSAAEGSFTDRITLNVSDEAIAGQGFASLTVDVAVQFVPVPEPACLLVAAVGLAVYKRRRASES